jgi:MacB-like periplasmic core domain
MGRIWRGLRLGLKSLLLHKLRSGLTTLGLTFGVAAVISMLAVGEGASRAIQRDIEQLGATNIILRSVKPSDEAQAASGRKAPLILRFGLTYADYLLPASGPKPATRALALPARTTIATSTFRSIPAGSDSASESLKCAPGVSAPKKRSSPSSQSRLIQSTR